MSGRSLADETIMPNGVPLGGMQYPELQKPVEDGCRA